MKLAIEYKLVISVLILISLASFLRLFKLASLPFSPYWEEVAVAYDAYSLLRTGSDHHGNFLPIVALESFGDWKPAGYAYAQIPFIATFGLTVFAARLPSALAGILVVVAVGWLSWKATNNMFAGLIGLLLAAISPWLIMFSRGGWESMFATALFWWGAILVFQGMVVYKKFAVKISLFGGLLLWLSAYSYHAMRLLVPMFLFGVTTVLLVQQFSSVQSRKSVLHGLRLSILNVFSRIWPLILLSIVAVTPFLLAWGTPQLGQRFSETSVFSDISIIEKSNEAISFGNESLPARIFNHRYILFAKRIVSNYLSHFSPVFLFTSGDSNHRHATGYGGQLYLLDAFLLIAGILAILKQFKANSIIKSNRSTLWIFFLLFLTVLTPLPASVTLATPHALRTLPMSVGLLSIAAVGAYSLYNTIKSWLYEYVPSSRETIGSLIILVCFVCIALYTIQPVAWWRHYTKIYPNVYYQDWQYGYERLYAELEIFRQKYMNIPIYVSRELGRPAMYLWFYTHTNPSDVQAAELMSPQDQGEFLAYGQYNFIRTASEVPNRSAIIAVTAHDHSQFERSILLTTVSSPTGSPIWYIYYQSE